MSFFALSTNEELTNIEKFEIENGMLEPIPNKTQVLAFAEEAKWDEYDGESYINIKWAVLQPVEYKNRKVFHKIKIEIEDPAKRDKALKMFAAIDTNAKGGLVAKGKRPTNADLQKLTQKPMVLMLQVWSIEDKNTGEMKRGNWVSAVSPKSAGTPDRVVPVVMETKEMTDDEAGELAF